MLLSIFGMKLEIGPSLMPPCSLCLIQRYLVTGTTWDTIDYLKQGAELKLDRENEHIPVFKKESCIAKSEHSIKGQIQVTSVVDGWRKQRTGTPGLVLRARAVS